MRTAWLRLRSRLDGHPGLVDAAVMVVCAIPLVTVYVLHLVGVDIDATPPVGSPRSPDALAFVLAAVVVAPVAVRRRWPLQASVVGLVAYILLVALGYPELGAMGGAAVLAHTLGCHVDAARRRPWSTALLVAGAVGVVASFGASFDLNPMIVLAAYFRGASVRSKRAYLEELERRVATADALAEEQARQAVLDERTRIAREMHDVVAHGMSVMVVQAGAASRVVAQHPDQAAEALDAIERTGRESLTEMRRLLGVLRGADGDGAPVLVPQPGIDDLPALAETFRDTSLDVALDVGVGEDLPSGLQLSVYRVVQEALTNALRHAGPARATVAVTRRGHVVEVRVDDDGRGAGTAAGSPGHGLAGMRERAALYGGTVDAGPRVGGGFSVVARFPVTVPLDGAEVAAS